MLAATSNALIVGFNVRPDSAARDYAARANVEIRTYRVIYDCLNEIEAAMKGMLCLLYTSQRQAPRRRARPHAEAAV